MNKSCRNCELCVLDLGFNQHIKRNEIKCAEFGVTTEKAACSYHLLECATVERDPFDGSVTLTYASVTS